MRTRPLIILAVLLALAACDETEDEGVFFDKEIKLKSGLVVSRPEGFDDRLEDGRIVLTETGDIRSPRIIAVALSKTAPALKDPDTRALAGATVRYKVSEEGTGSGGTEYQMQAVRPVDDRFLVLTAFVQAEIGPPDFAIAWTVLEHAEVE